MLPQHRKNQAANDQRREVAKAHSSQLAKAKSQTVFLLPTGGCGEWDRPGADLHDSEGLAAFCDEIRITCPENITLEELDCHINDAEFAEAALAIFDDWCARGIVAPGIDIAD